MAVTVVRSLGVQTASAIGNAANADTASFAALPAVGNHIIGTIAGWDNDVTIGIDNFTDNQGNTYTRHLNVTNTDYDCYTGGASAKVATSSGTFTVGIDLIGGNNYVVWDAMEVSGLDASAWFDKTGTNNSATGDANATASGANATTDGIAVGVCAVNNGSSDINIDDTPPSGFTMLSFYNDASGIIGGAFAYKIYSATETSSVQFVHDNVSQTGWTCGIMTFKAAGGGTTSKSGSDTPSISISEGTSTLAGSSSNTDTPTVSLSESVALAGSSSQSDTPTVSIGDVSAVMAGLGQTDAPAVAISESTSISVVIASTDNPTVGISDAVSIAGNSTQSDTPTVNISESIVLAGSSSQSDNPTVAINEVIVIAGVSSQTDTPTVSITDSATVAVVGFITGSDAPTLSISENATVVVLVSVADTVTVGTAEGAVSLAVMLSPTDTLNVGISDTVSPIASSLSVSDTVAIELTESINIASVLLVADLFALVVADMSSTVINQSISVSDGLLMSLTDSASINIEGSGVLKELFLHPRTSHLILSNRSSRLE